MLAAIARAYAATAPAVSLTNPGVASGGGTVSPDPANTSCDASFGLNSVRPNSFPSGQAIGRLNYNKNDGCPNAHVNVPIVIKTIEATQTTGPNGTGGSAQMAGDCGALNSVCPPGIQSVQVSVQDNADSGAGSDIFKISFCSGAASPTSFPTGCGAEEGGLLSTGNIQVRPPP